MSALLIAERFNGETWRPLCQIPSEKYLKLALRLGVFRRGPSRKRLASISVDFDESMNLLPADPSGARWDAQLAHAVADYVRANARWDVLFLCGRRVAQAFDLPKCEFGTRFGLVENGYTVEPSEAPLWACVVPHPSGLSYWWRDSESRHVFREMLDARNWGTTTTRQCETMPCQAQERQAMPSLGTGR